MISSRMRLFGAVVALLVGVGGAASAQQLELITESAGGPTSARQRERAMRGVMRAQKLKELVERARAAAGPSRGGAAGKADKGSTAG